MLALPNSNIAITGSQLLFGYLPKGKRGRELAMLSEDPESTHRRRKLEQLIRVSFGGVQARFIKATGINQGELSAIIGGKKSFGRRKASTLEGQLGLSKGYFEQPLDEDGDTNIAAIVPDTPVSVHRGEVLTPRDGFVHRIPKLNVAGGQGNGALLPAVEYESSMIEVSDDWVRHNLPGVRLSNLQAIAGFGPSMMPTFGDGDILFVDVSVTRLVHDRIFALYERESRELYIKRVTRYPLEERWSITSDNPLHNNPPLASMVTLEQISGRLGVGGCVVGKWSFAKL